MLNVIQLDYTGRYVSRQNDDLKGFCKVLQIEILFLTYSFESVVSYFAALILGNEPKILFVFDFPNRLNSFFD